MADDRLARCARSKNANIGNAEPRGVHLHALFRESNDTRLLSWATSIAAAIIWDLECANSPKLRSTTSPST
jgi:hypothetical protein